jgi:transposase
MGHIEGDDRDQMTLFPEALDDYVSQENPVRFIDAFVGSLDLEGLDFAHAVPNDLGRPPYNPADLLRLYTYGYLNRVRSSRQLEKEANRNVELMWLLRRLAPDFKTIADFRKDNAQAIRGSGPWSPPGGLGEGINGCPQFSAKRFTFQVYRVHF